MKRSLGLFVALSLVVVGCSSSTNSSSSGKKAASGTAAKTTKTPTTAAKPSKKAAPNLTSSTNSAVAIEQVACGAEEEGLGACAEDFAVFCADGKAWALECGTAYSGSSCGDVDGTIACVVDDG